MNSTRFPGKVLADLCGKPVLKHVIDRVRMCNSRVSDVAVALSRGDDWEPIAGHCEEWGVKCHAFNVPEDDVLQRYVRACDYWKADVCVRVCGDNPLVMPDEINKIVEYVWDDKSEIAVFSIEQGKPIISRPTGYFAEAMTYWILRECDSHLKKADPLREHVTAAMYKSQYDYWPLPSWYTTINPPNAAIDTPEDLERVAAMLTTKATA
jgi:spore coat polysaccharide biosynthesis protein SpsF